MEVTKYKNTHFSGKNDCVRVRAHICIILKDLSQSLYSLYWILETIMEFIEGHCFRAGGVLMLS